MDKPSRVFDPIDRVLLHAILIGEANGTNGVKVAKYRPKVEESLRRRYDNIPSKSAISATIRRGSNNQEIWLAVYEVVEAERPGLFDKLRKSQT